MKISEMDKTDLVNYMKASHEMVRFDRNSPSWKRAFQLAKLAGYENITMDCQSCANKVYQWLNK